MPVITPTGGVGGGGFTPVAANLARDADIDVHAVGFYPIRWDNLVDNEYDYNTIAAIPAGLGLSFSFDGSAAGITTTAAGIWSFTGTIIFADPDATFRGRLVVSFSQFGLPLGPIATAQTAVTTSQTYNLPAGAVGDLRLLVDTGSAANPYNAHGDLCIVRLA